MPRSTRKHRPGGPRTHRHQPDTGNRQQSRALHTDSKQWQAIRREVMARDLFTCRECRRAAVGRNGHVDHVDGDSTNNPADGSNWQLLCRWCHSRKTRREMNLKRREGGARV